MKKLKRFKVLFIAVVAAFSAVLLSCQNLTFNSVVKSMAAKEENVINYVSLGDSIAVGYLLSGHSTNDEPSYNSASNTYSQGKFISGSYSDWFKTKLVDSFGATKVNAVTYAKSGDKIKDLLNKLNATNISSDIANADVVTICIGANDILGPATEHIYDFIKKDPSYTIQQMDGFLDAGLASIQDSNGVEGDFTKLLKKLTNINPKAKYIFTNVYNPYKYLGIECDDWLDEWFLSQFIDIDNVEVIGHETGIYLAGGTNSSGKNVKGLNQILAEGINSWINQGHENFALVDTYSVFEKYSVSEYSDLVNCWLTSDYNVIEVIRDLDWGNISNQDELEQEILEAIDPHPKKGGHVLLYGAFESAIHLAKFDTNGGNIVNDQVAIKNKKLEKPSSPTKDNYIFAGWYKDNAFQNVWNFGVDGLLANTTLYAKWTNLNCEDQTKLSQIVNKTQPINFSIDVVDSVEWYVNDQKQAETSKTFTFTPDGSNASYDIYCMVGGVKSANFTVNVDYIEPNEITIESQQLQTNSYKVILVSEDIESIDVSKIVWYKNSQILAEGVGEVVVDVDEDVNVYATYQGSDVTSNSLNFSPTNETPQGGGLGDAGEENNVIYFVCAVLGVAMFIFIVAVIKAKVRKSKTSKNKF